MVCLWQSSDRVINQTQMSPLTHMNETTETHLFHVNQIISCSLVKAPFTLIVVFFQNCNVSLNSVSKGNFKIVLEHLTRAEKNDVLVNNLIIECYQTTTKNAEHIEPFVRHNNKYPDCCSEEVPKKCNQIGKINITRHLACLPSLLQKSD